MNVEQYINRCLTIAEYGKGAVAPNPMVGAVLVYNDRIIAEGWHQQYGQNHAEVNCLENVRVEDRDLIPECTMYVSLEPCAHYGKTPPCSERLVKEQVKKVVICNDDPYAEVDGKGLKILRDAGIEVASNILEGKGYWLNRRFFTFHQKKRPYIILKWAQTQQGYFAPVNRTRFQMSNPDSRQMVHKWRTEEAAIMVGHRTAISDDPQLTSRYWQGRNPLRIVLDKRLTLPHDLKLFNNESATWVINEIEKYSKENIDYKKLDFDNNLLHTLLDELYYDHKTSLIVEGGATLLQSFINLGLWDEARVFTTQNVLEEGVHAPLVNHVDHVYETAIGSDRLNVYTHKDMPYKYVAGMQL